MQSSDIAGDIVDLVLADQQAGAAMTKIEFGIKDVHDTSGVLVFFEVFIVIRRGGQPIARGVLGQYAWREDAERAILKAHETVEVRLVL